jgi:SAM-dependent methyltransferase
LELISPYNHDLLKPNSDGLTDSEGRVFPEVNGVVRIVSGDNYTDNFGFQWNKFSKTQIDREKKDFLVSKVRFFEETNWDPLSLKGCNVLEVGCGAGRFSQVVLSNTKANLYSVDFSSAVEANYQNNRKYKDRIKIFQASIYEMPFKNNSFDRIFCLGVLQHTPNFEDSVKSLAEKLAINGELVVDFYPINGWWTKINAKYILRPWVKRFKHKKLLSLIERNVDWLIAFYFLNQKIGLGKFLNRFLPIPNILSTIPNKLSSDELRDWVILDTFDMFSPEYDNPQTIKQVKEWMESAGLQVIFADYVYYGNSKAAVVRAKKYSNANE